MTTVTSIPAQHGDYVCVTESDGEVYITLGDKNDGDQFGVYLSVRSARDLVRALQTAIEKAI